MSALGAGQSFFDQMLGFRPGNKDVGGDREIEPAELLNARDVLRGLAPAAALHAGPQALPLFGLQALFRMGVEEGLADFEYVTEEDFGGQAGNGDSGMFENLGCLPERFPYRGFSVWRSFLCSERVHIGTAHLRSRL